MIICISPTDSTPHILLYQGHSYYYVFCDKKFDSKDMNNVSVNNLTVQHHISGLCKSCITHYHLNYQSTVDVVTSKMQSLISSDQYVESQREDTIGPKDRFSGLEHRYSRKINKYITIVHRR